MVSEKERAFVEQWGEMMYEMGLFDSPAETRQWIEDTIEYYESNKGVGLQELVEDKTEL